jgi:hypothetical protein
VLLVRDRQLRPARCPGRDAPDGELAGLACLDHADDGPAHHFVDLYGWDIAPRVYFEPQLVAPCDETGGVGGNRVTIKPPPHRRVKTQVPRLQQDLAILEVCFRGDRDVLELECLARDDVGGGSLGEDDARVG